MNTTTDGDVSHAVSLAVVMMFVLASGLLGVSTMCTAHYRSLRWFRDVS